MKIDLCPIFAQPTRATLNFEINQYLTTLLIVSLLLANIKSFVLNLTQVLSPLSHLLKISTRRNWILSVTEMSGAHCMHLLYVT